MSQITAKKRIGIALRRFARGTSPSKKYQKYFDCDPEFLRAFIGHQFIDERQDWDGLGEDWVIGHVIPIERFDQENPADLALCWNWINLKVFWNVSNHFNAKEAVTVLEARFARWPGNAVIVELLMKAKSLSATRLSEPDWGKFVNGD